MSFGQCILRVIPIVSVPLRGVGCFLYWTDRLLDSSPVSVPLRGVGCFDPAKVGVFNVAGVSVPLRGVGCFQKPIDPEEEAVKFPSPCGV